MQMRLEGHAILWVTALLSVGLAAFYGNVYPYTTSIFEAGLPERFSTEPDQEVESEGKKGFPEMSAALAEPSLSARPLFYFEVAPTQPAPSAEVVKAEAVPPVLKGILSSDSGYRAVFSVDPSTANYVSAAAGDVVGGYRLKEILRDQVVAADHTGGEVIFILRGAGESR